MIKLVSFLVAVIVALSMSTPAYAANGDPTLNLFDVTTGTSVITCTYPATCGFVHLTHGHTYSWTGRTVGNIKARTMILDGGQGQAWTNRNHAEGWIDQTGCHNPFTYINTGGSGQGTWVDSGQASVDCMLYAALQGTAVQGLGGSAFIQTKVGTGILKATVILFDVL